MPKQIYEIDGARINSLEDFFAEVSHNIIPNAEWGRNLDAFNDILRGGFGTPDEGFVIRWKNSALSRERLGYGQGSTIFDTIVEVIRHHGADGDESSDGVELELR